MIIINTMQMIQKNACNDLYGEKLIRLRSGKGDRQGGPLICLSDGMGHKVVYVFVQEEKGGNNTDHVFE